MDNRMKQSLDTYIISGRYRESREIIACKECGHKFLWKVCEEYSASWYEPEDVICPECGAEYNEEEEN